MQTAMSTRALLTGIAALFLATGTAQRMTSCQRHMLGR
jgi:hypothetical protein